MRRSHIPRAIALLALVLALASSPAAPQTAGETPQARAALDRAVRFMGGPDVVYSLRTLVIASDNVRVTDAGPVTVPTRTSYAFPLSVRQEITLNGRTIAMASSPAGGVLFTEDGPSPLDEQSRLTVEQATMRNPVVLMKARLGRSFTASLSGGETIEGREADVIRIVQNDNETLAVVDRKSGRLIAIRYEIAAARGQMRRIVVRFDDWRPASSGLRYPFAARGEEDGQRAFIVTTRAVVVNEPLSMTEFAAGFGEAAPGLRR